MSFTGTPPSSIAISGGTFNNGSYQTQGTPTTSYVKYNLYNSSNVSHGSGYSDIYFSIVSGNLHLTVQDATDNDTVYEPHTFVATGGASSSGVATGQVTAGDDYDLYNQSTFMGTITIPTQLSTGPTVTSITEDTIYVPTDSVAVTDFTLTKNTSSYATSNISLTGPTTMTNSGARGYLYDLVSNVSHDSGVYDFTINSKSFVKFRYNDDWTSSPTSGRSSNSTRILNVLGKIPTTTVLTATGPTLPSNNGADQLFEIIRTNRFIEYGIGTSYNGSYQDAPAERVAFVVDQGTTDIQGYFYYYNSDDLANTYQESTKFVIGAQQTITWAGANTVSSGHNGNLALSVTDWVYNNEPEGDGYGTPTHVSAYTAKGNSRNFW